MILKKATVSRLFGHNLTIVLNKILFFVFIFWIKESLKLKPTFGVKIAKAEGNYHADLLEPLSVHEEESKCIKLAIESIKWNVKYHFG